MDPGRRAILVAGAALVVAAGGASRAGACSLSASRRPRAFRRGECERELEALVRMLNEGPSMPREAVEQWYTERGFEIEYDLLPRDAEGLTSEVDFLRDYRMSGGRLDSNPIRLVELELVRQRGNRAAFAFALKRHSYHPADPEGCNGLFTHGEFWGEEQAGYIATFMDNRLRQLRAFPEWFADT